MLDNWITRVWTLQEYALNPNVYFFISMPPSERWKYTSLLVHGDFWNLILAKISQTEGFDELERNNFLLVRERWKDWLFMWITRLRYWKEEFQTYSPAEQLIQVYEGTSMRKCSVPHDQVYGMLSMVNFRKLPEELMPNYNTPFGDVFWQYTKYIIAETGDLRIIQCVHNELVGYPSWVPNLRFNGDLNVSIRSPVIISGNGRRLIVQGSKLGTVLATLHPSGSQEEYLSNIQDTILTASARVQRRPATDIFQQWFHDFTANFRDVRPMEFEAQFQSMEHILVKAQKGTSRDEMEPFRNDISILAELVLEKATNVGWVLLDNGDVLYILKGIASKISGMISGAETIWALKGCSSLSVLQSCENGYIYLGHCGLPSNTVMDDNFFSGRSIENVTLT